MSLADIAPIRTIYLALSMVLGLAAFEASRGAPELAEPPWVYEPTLEGPLSLPACTPRSQAVPEDLPISDGADGYYVMATVLSVESEPINAIADRVVLCIAGGGPIGIDTLSFVTEEPYWRPDMDVLVHVVPGHLAPWCRVPAGSSLFYLECSLDAQHRGM